MLAEDWVGRCVVLPEDLVGWCVVLQPNRGVTPYPQPQFKSGSSQASDAPDAQDATNNLC